MAFYGTSMIFDGIACEEMGLMLCEFDNCQQDATKFTSNLAIQEDRIGRRYRSLFYGGTVNEPLVFRMVLCAREDRVQRGEPFDRWDFQKIAAWLTGHEEYKWLHIVQDDLENVRFRCICSELEAVEVAGRAWGFACNVTCDSPYAYMLPQAYTTTVSAGTTTDMAIFSESSHNGFYYPKITISAHSGGDFSITVKNNKEENTFQIRGLPSKSGKLTIDCENEVIISEDDINPYRYVDFPNGFHFPRFVRGSNEVLLAGAGTYSFVCEWPVNVGG